MNYKVYFCKGRHGFIYKDSGIVIRLNEDQVRLLNFLKEKGCLYPDFSYTDCSSDVATDLTK